MVSHCAGCCLHTSHLHTSHEFLALSDACWLLVINWPGKHACPAGALLKAFHKQYWIGYQVPPTSAWPNFTMVDRAVPASTYTHWGVDRSTNKSEPNNLAGNENCLAANSSQEYGGAWGWSDAVCNTPMPFMCRLLRE